jgi:hypothetical protein
MATKNMLIIKNEHDEVIAAQVEDDLNDSEVMSIISPADPKHTLHRVSEVPAEIHGLANPIEFQKAINDHVKSPNAKVAPTNADELHAKISRAFASRRSK